jgi:serine/threonine-protein kinase
MDREVTVRIGDSVTVPGVFLERRGLLPIGSGDVLDGRYVVEGELGTGGEGVVFRAWDVRAREAVAVKFLHPRLAARPGWVRRFEREMELARRVRHPNVCSILDFRRGLGPAFIVMELAVGDALDELPGAQVDWARRLEDARGVCRGVAAIHDAGVIHRDIKPGNLLRMTDGRIAVADFGLAVAADETASMTGGTPNYLPPEVTFGDRHDARSDLWQLGVVLHEIILGRRPSWRRRSDGPWTPRQDDEVPPEIGRIVESVLRCLRWDPADRPEDARAVARCLES